MWWQLHTSYEQNLIENLQMLQQQFFELCMKPNDNIANHIGTIEVLAHQLNDHDELLFDQAIMTRILFTLSRSYKYMHVVWDNIPPKHQTIKNLILCLLKGQNRNCMHTVMRLKTLRCSLQEGQISTMHVRHLWQKTRKNA